MALAVVRDLRVARAPVTPEDLEALETDVLAGFVLARAAAGLSDGTISSDVVHLEQVRAWFGRPLWEMEPADADAYFGKVLRVTAKGTRLARAQAIKTFFLFLEFLCTLQAGCRGDQSLREEGASEVQPMPDRLGGSGPGRSIRTAL
ncbi:hypothetical protein [Nonomuraea sp. NPDC049695]|uniref:hypothetical protein n=1 Tax=Nonomuraea sp. NPDC049695 TaxID=3154734 RepID=UPI003423CDE0